MRRLLFIAGAGAILGTSAALFHISYGVETLEDRLAGLNRQIVAEQQAIRVLRAEWAYLNRPDRLAELAAAHTELTPMQPDQIIETVRVIPAPLPGVDSPGDAEALMSLVEMPGFGALPVPPRRPGSRATAPAATRTAEAATGAGAAPRVRPAAPAPADAAAAVPVSAGSADPMAALIATVGAEGGGGGR